MGTEYPTRPKAPEVVRYLCMAFGLANIVASIVLAPKRDAFMLIGGLLVGSAWFAFGKYGGLPLFDTVHNWQPPGDSAESAQKLRQGLLVMRRRRWMTWISLPVAFGTMALIVPVLIPYGQPQLALLLIGVPLAVIQLRYYLSRCPRCGFGFFTKSTSRAAMIRRGKACGHCGLSLNT